MYILFVKTLTNISNKILQATVLVFMYLKINVVGLYTYEVTKYKKLAGEHMYKFKK